MSQKQKILIVDDRKENLVALRQVLREEKADLVEATSGNQALAATLDHQFALAILDVQMPQMSGYELAEYLREDEKTRHIPIIFLTAHSLDERSVFKGYESGGIDYIIKPYDPRIMLGKVRQFLKMDCTMRQLQDHRDQLEDMVAERTQALRQEVQVRRQAQQKAEHLNSVLSSIRRINQLIVRAEDEEALLQAACELLVETRGYAGVWIISGEPETGVEYLAMTWRDKDSSSESLSVMEVRWPTCFQKAAQTSDGIAIVRSNLECDGCPLRNMREAGPVVVTLLRRGGEVMGLMGVAVESGSEVIDDEQSLLLEVAEDIAFALHDIKIERQHDLFVEIVANSQEAMSLVDRQYRYLKVNPSYQKLVGRLQEEIEGHKVVEVLGKEFFLESVKGKLDHCFAGKTVRFEIWRELPDGDHRLLEALYSPCRAPDGSVYAAAAALRDITEQRRAEEAFLAESQRAQQYFGTAGVIMVVIDREGKVVRINSKGCEVLGYGEGEIVGKNWFDNFVTPEIREVILPLHKSLLDGKANRASYNENTVLTRDGSERLIAWYNTIVRDENGRIVGHLSSGEDVTDVRTTECEREQLIAAIEQSDDAVVITDSGGNIIYINPAFTQMSGYTQKEALGQNPRLLNSGEHDQVFYRELWQTISGGHTWRGRLVNKRKDGTLYTEEARISPVFGQSGTITNYVAIKTDITERLRLQAERSHLEEQMRQAQKMESVGRLAGGVAHDFNNMLSIIIGYAEIAADDVDEQDPLQKNLEQILDAAIRARDLTRQLLAFARRQTVSPQVIDLNEVLGKSKNMLGRLIGEDIDLKLIPCDNLWPIMLDPAQIDQIVANLAVNARDAISGVGSVIIETHNTVLGEEFCSNHVGLEPGEYVMLNFSDTGMGMDRETLDKAFEPFFTTKKDGKGTGLGLSTVYGIARQAGGLVSVYSEPDQGTTFKIYLPRCDQAPEKDVAELGVMQICGSETVMVVEDETQILDLCQQVLRRAGYQVISTSKPDEALVLAEKHQGDIHLLITDVVMPSMNGKELKERLEKIKPGIKALYMSGYTANIIAHRGVLAEGVQFLQKPFATKDLALKVRQVLKYN